jgi:hypothetical protein
LFRENNTFLQYEEKISESSKQDNLYTILK